MKTEHWTGETPCKINGFRKTEFLIYITVFYQFHFERSFGKKFHILIHYCSRMMTDIMIHCDRFINYIVKSFFFSIMSDDTIIIISLFSRFMRKSLCKCSPLRNRTTFSQYLKYYI